ncbi:MAG: helix-turn-helix transcriptional regulator [Rhizobiales bacterium]|nr:helix-turn-helix transcriptional regulator [Hyphomicrobiales bacterium]
MPTVPIPGRKVRGSASGVPIMALFDLLGRRWAMGVVWTLCKDGPCSFRTLQARCDAMSPTVLNVRLKELREAGLVGLSDAGYAATAQGHELYLLLRPLGAWSKQWAGALAAGRAPDEGPESGEGT